MSKSALVVGASGIVGSATATLLVEQGWTVYGLARRRTTQDGVRPVTADLQDGAGTAHALRGVSSDAVFITAWLRQDSEPRTLGSMRPWSATCSIACRSRRGRGTWRW